MSRADGWLYTMVSALGAGEFWGSNSNADYFGMEPLLHTPPGWDMLPADKQKIMGARWEWGYPTFYNAHAFQHHVNKDPARAFGTVEYVLWDPRMKRVLLIVGINRAKAKELGAIGVVDRIENGEYPDVSMGCKVPFDVCSICGDMDLISPYLSTPKRILQMHRQRPIRGISATTAEYCQHLKFELNKIYPDGRRVMMLNLHPRFFDISFVFIGADKTSKMLAKLAHGKCPIKTDSPICKQGCTSCNPQGAVPSSHIYNVWSRDKAAYVSPARGTTGEPVPIPEQTTPEPTMDASEARKLKKKIKTAEELFEDTLNAPLEKTAAAVDEGKIKEAFGIEDFDIDPADEDAVSSYYRKKYAPGRLIKKSEIAKRVSSHFGGRALPLMERRERDIPSDVQDKMSEDLPGALSTAGSLGMVVKPKEFQRMMLVSCGKKDVADDLEARRLVFRPGAAADPSFSIADSIVPRILKSLLPMMGERSAFGPTLHKRIVITISRKAPPPMGHRGCGGPLMDKLSSAYTSYRRGLIYKTAGLVKQAVDSHPEILQPIFGGDLIRSFGGGLVKEGGDVMESLIGGILPVIYLNQAYTDGMVSRYVSENPDLDGLTRVGELAAFGGVA